MLKPRIRIGMVGALVAGGSALVLWACVPAQNVIGTDPGKDGTADVTPATKTGQVKVAIQMPSDARTTQSVLDKIDSIDLSISGASWSPALTAKFTKNDLTGNSATKTFTEVPAGTATVAAKAKDSAGAELATASANVTVIRNETVHTTLTLTFRSGDVAAEIEVIVTSPVTIGEHGALQTGATYVGGANCASCHSDTQEHFKDTAHFKGVRDSKTGLIRYPAKGRPSCAVCHATGADAASYGSETPFDFLTKTAEDAPNNLVSTITCEACHGPGSKHASVKYADRFKSITRVPAAANTCATCHAGYLKQYKESGKPVYEPGSTSYQVYGVANLPATGATEEHYMAGGGHNALGMGPVGSVINQTGGYTGGVAPTFANAHKTQTKNGCVSCHMGSLGGEKHSFEITTEGTGSALVNSCQTCHGTGFTADSIKAYQGQTKLALARMKDALIAFRQTFATKYHYKPRTGAQAESTDAAYATNLNWVPSIWDDSDDYVKNATASSPTNFTDKANWTDGNNHWSNHQKIYNRAYWNYSLANGEGSYGIHAPTYTQTLLRNSYNELVNEFIAQNKPASSSFSVLMLK